MADVTDANAAQDPESGAENSAPGSIQDLEQQSPEEILESVADNPAARTTAMRFDPQLSLAETRNASAGSGPNGAGGNASSTAEEHVPGTSDPESSDLPTANAPDPKLANPQVNPNSTQGKRSGASS